MVLLPKGTASTVTLEQPGVEPWIVLPKGPASTVTLEQRGVERERQEAVWNF